MYYQLKVPDSQLRKANDAFTELPVAMSKDILGILTRPETGRGPHMLPLKFTRQFAFKETLMLLHLHLLPFLSLSLSLFSFLFPHSFGLPLCSLLHPLCFSGPVGSSSCVLSCSGGREEWYRMLAEARPPSGRESHSWALSLASFHHCWGCDVPFCRAWHVPFLVTIQPVFRFLKKNSIPLPHVTGCTCASLFC